jgi:methionyl-tRNA formyltransferase
MLSSVRGGWIGIHNSLLPRYRGGSPLVWQILNGETEAGFSLFQFTPGMDDGPIWAQGSVPIESGDQIGDVLEKLEVATIDTLRRVLPEIAMGILRPALQDHTKATYCAQRYPEDGRIDWSHSARRIHDFVRAQSAPYPGAFTEIDGRRLTVWSTIPHAALYDGVPGRIARIEEAAVVVCCGERSAIRLLDVQCDDFRGPPAKLIRSVRQRLGK